MGCCDNNERILTILTPTKIMKSITTKILNVNVMTAVNCNIFQILSKKSLKRINY